MVQCACCQAVRDASLNAQAPHIMRVHDLLTNPQAVLACGQSPEQKELQSLFLHAYGGEESATLEERTCSLLHHLADELLNCRGVVMVQDNEAMRSGGDLVHVLVCKQRAVDMVEKAAEATAREARRRHAIDSIKKVSGSSRIVTRIADGSRQRRVWSVGDEGREDGSKPASTQKVDATAEEVPVPLRLEAECPEAAPRRFRPVTVVLVDVATLTPVPESLKAPEVKVTPSAPRLIELVSGQGGPSQAYEGLGKDHPPPTAVVEGPLEGSDEQAPLTTTQQCEDGVRPCRPKRAPKHKSTAREAEADTAESSKLLAPSNGPMVSPAGVAFSADDAMRFMLRIGYTAPISVADLPDRGRCVFSDGFIPRGAFVTEYAGQLIPYAEARDREARYRFLDRGASGCYMYWFSVGGHTHCIDATAVRPQYGIGRLISHSRRAPTCFTRRFVVDGTPRLALLASRDIMFGEELSYDYGDTSSTATRAFEWLKNT